MPASRSIPTPMVSDHALVRWLERVHGIDMDAFRAEIAATVEGAVATGATGLVRDGVTYVLKGATVVSIVPGRAKDGCRVADHLERQARQEARF